MVWPKGFVLRDMKHDIGKYHGLGGEFIVVSTPCRGGMFGRWAERGGGRGGWKIREGMASDLPHTWCLDAAFVVSVTYS